MTTNGRGYRGLATQLHALLVVEMRRKCEYCGKKYPERPCGHIVVRKECEDCQTYKRRSTLQCAHHISRTYNDTRTDLDNAYCFCAGCHRYTTNWPREFGNFVERKTGDEKYLEMKTRVESKTPPMDWEEEHARLCRIAEEAGIEHECHMRRNGKICSRPVKKSKPAKKRTRRR